MKILILCSALIMSGCATCSQHPVACTIAGAIIVGSVAAIAEAHHDHNRDVVTIRNISPRYSTNGAAFSCREPDGRATAVVGSYSICHGQ